MSELVTRERPILFSAPMVRAILAGQKTQTRRLLAAKPAPGPLASFHKLTPIGRALFTDNTCTPCRYGSVGDTLWVRETWRLSASRSQSQCALYAADLSEYDRAEKGPWRPSIFMPRWASRITLRVTSVRVERLQDITESDVLAEGLDVPTAAAMTGIPWSDMPTLHDAWRYAWDHINGKRASWDSNPWVWVVGFERLTPRVCKCDMRTKLVGDGCDVCNPTLAAEVRDV